MNAPVEPRSRRRLLHAHAAVVAPGLLVAAALAGGGFALSALVGAWAAPRFNPLSPILCALVIGVVGGNVFPLPATLKAGVHVGYKQILRIGIALMGIRLSFVAVVKIGAFAFGLVAVCIITGLCAAMIAARRLGVSPQLGYLIAAGTSICGVSAVVACAPVVGANENETGYAIGVVTVFGLLATLIYPYLVEVSFHLSVVQAGFFLGTSVHDTSQVAATALMYDQLWMHRTPEGLSGADIAITTKLVRNTFLAIVIPVLGFLAHRRMPGSGGSQTGGQSPSSRRAATADGQTLATSPAPTDRPAPIARRVPIPMFVIAFVLFGVVRTSGDALFGDAEVWVAFYSGTKTLAIALIAVAIACVGLNTDLRRFREFGLKPSVVGLFAALCVGAVSLGVVSALGRPFGL